MNFLSDFISEQKKKMDVAKVIQQHKKTLQSCIRKENKAKS